MFPLFNFSKKNAAGPLAFMILLVLIFAPALIFADVVTPGSLTNPLKFGSIPCLINALLEIIVKIGSVVLVIFFVITGFLFVKAQGNPEELKTAKTAFLWTVVGSGIVLGAFVISQAIQNTVVQLGATAAGAAPCP